MGKQVQELMISIRQRINELYSDIDCYNTIRYHDFLWVVLHPDNDDEQREMCIVTGFRTCDIEKAISIRVDHNELPELVVISSKNVVNRFFKILIDGKAEFDRSMIDDLYCVYVRYTNSFFHIKDVPRCTFIRLFQEYKGCRVIA